MKSNIPKIIAILGMHRSGTSCLIGSLHKSGFSSRNTLKFSSANKKGSREFSSIMRLNDIILANNGGSWRKPPSTISFDQELIDRRDEIIAKNHKTNCIFLFKDPRSLLLLEFWQKDLSSINFIGTFRDPAQVIRSLFMRDQIYIPLADGLKLWIKYNENLLRLHEEKGFPLIYFGGDNKKYTQAIKHIIQQINDQYDFPEPLDPNMGAKFYELQFQHNKEYEIIVSSMELKSILQQANKLFNQLLIRCINPPAKKPNHNKIQIPVTSTLEELLNLKGIDKNTSIYFIILSRFYKENKDFKSCLIYAKKALNLKPNDKNVLELIVSIFHSQNKAKEALNFINDNNNHKVPLEDLLILKLQTSKATNDVEGTIEIARQLIELNPIEVHHFKYCDLLFRNQQFDEVIKLEDLVVNNYMANINFVKLLGISFFRKRIFNKALFFLKNFISTTDIIDENIIKIIQIINKELNINKSKL